MESEELKLTWSVNRVFDVNYESITTVADVVELLKVLGITLHASTEDGAKAYEKSPYLIERKSDA